MNATASVPTSGRRMVFRNVVHGLSPMMWETMMNFLSTNWKLLLISRKQVGSV